MSIKYTIDVFYTQSIVCMTDPVFSHPWYLKSVRNGQYDWTRDPLYAKRVSLATAKKHVAALESGADTAWKEYSKSWSDYYASIGIAR